MRSYCLGIGQSNMMLSRYRTVAAAALLTVATYAAAVSPAGEHSEEYKVRRGDTLWGIAHQLLPKPWLWPEIWQNNPQVHNPHLIYPGDIIHLRYGPATLGQSRGPVQANVESGPRQDAPVNTIDTAQIQPFLRDLQVRDEFQSLPYVVGISDGRQRGTSGDKIDVVGLSSVQVGQRFTIVRPTVDFAVPKPTEDLEPDGRQTPHSGNLWKEYFPPTKRAKEILGFELAKVNIGTVSRPAQDARQVTTLSLQETGREVRAGDRLIPVEAQIYDAHFVPHPPQGKFLDNDPRILAVADTFTSAGPRDVIAISAGSRDGVDNGTVVSVWQHGKEITDRIGSHRSTSMPDEGYRQTRRTWSTADAYVGHAMVFRTFEKVSYALIIEAIAPSRVGYALKHPDAQ